MSNLYDTLINEYFGELMYADGFNEAIIGLERREMRVIYSVEKCIEILMRDMTEEEAIDYFDFNVRYAYIGEKTPIWCDTLSLGHE